MKSHHYAKTAVYEVVVAVVEVAGGGTSSFGTAAVAFSSAIWCFDLLWSRRTIMQLRLSEEKRSKAWSTSLLLASCGSSMSLTRSTASWSEQTSHSYHRVNNVDIHLGVLYETYSVACKQDKLVILGQDGFRGIGMARNQFLHITIT